MERSRWAEWTDRHCVRPGLGYQDLKLKRDGHTVQGERMMTAILGAQLSFPIRFLIHIPEHLKDKLLVKAVRWHCRVSGLGTEHQWEHDLPLCSSIPPCRGWDRAGNKVLLFPELFSFAFDPVWGNDSLSVHSPRRGRLQPWLAPAQHSGSKSPCKALVCFSVLQRDGVVTKGKQGER